MGVEKIMANSVRLYTIAFEKDEKPIKNLSILDFFKKLEKYLETRNRTKTIFDKVITCSKFYKDDNYKERIIISFGKLKEGLSFKFNDKGNFEEIDMDIFNVNSFEYDDFEKIIAITTNGAGPGIKYIEAYLNSFLQSNFEYNIKIRALNKGIEILKKANFIRRVEFVLDLTHKFPSINYSNKTNVFRALFELVKSTKEDLETKTFILALGVGNSKRESSLALDNVLEMLEEIDINQNFIKEIYVIYKNDMKEKTDLSKLKEYKMMIEHYFKINTNLISPEYLRDNWDNLILEKKLKYYKSKNQYFEKSLECNNQYYDLGK